MFQHDVSISSDTWSDLNVTVSDKWIDNPGCLQRLMARLIDRLINWGNGPENECNSALGFQGKLQSYRVMC